MHSRINAAVVAGATIVSIAGGAAVVSAAPAASAAVCKTTNTYTHSTTSAGSQTWEWVKKIACGTGNYTRWEHKAFRSYTGMHYTENVHRIERNSTYWQSTWKDETSAKGVVTITLTYQTG